MYNPFRIDWLTVKSFEISHRDQNNVIRRIGSATENAQGQWDVEFYVADTTYYENFPDYQGAMDWIKDLAGSAYGNVAR